MSDKTVVFVFGIGWAYFMHACATPRGMMAHVRDRDGDDMLVDPEACIHLPKMERPACAFASEWSRA